MARERGEARGSIRMDQAMAIRLASIAAVGVVIGFGAALAAWWKRGRGDAVNATGGAPDSAATGPIWAIPLAAGLAYLVLHVAVLSRAPWPMVSAQDRIPIAAIAGLVLALLARRVRFGLALRWIVRAIVVLGVGAFIAWRQVNETWSASQSAVNLGGFVGATLLTWWALERVTDRPPTASTAATSNSNASAARAQGVSAALVASAVAGGAANALAITYSSLSLAQLGGILATVMIGVAMACAIRPRTSLAMGGAHVVALVTQAVLLVGIITTATAYERVYPWLVAAVPMAAVAVDMAMARRNKAWIHAAARVIAAAIIVGAITGLAMANMPSFEYDY